MALCPNCGSSMIGAEGTAPSCAQCGWPALGHRRILTSDGPALKSIEHPPGGIERAAAFAGSVVELETRIRELEKRKGELIDAILEHRRATPPGASAIDQKLWGEVL